MLKRTHHFIFLCFVLAYTSCGYAKTISIDLLGPTEPIQPIGTVTATDTPYGLLLIPHLNHLPNGQHGFHVHENLSCADAGMAAGGHLDPKKTNTHLGPYNNHGHLGDLPALYVDKDGRATTPILAPRLKIADIQNHAIMIHAGGDNYTDTPPNGGGGARLACGIIH